MRVNTKWSGGFWSRHVGWQLTVLLLQTVELELVRLVLGFFLEAARPGGELVLFLA